MNRSYQPTISKERTHRLQRPVLTVYAFTITVFIMALLIFAQFIAKMQGDLIYQEKIQAGKIGLSHFVNNAAIPLLDDDALSLNALLKEANAIDGALYAAVVDDRGTVRAHTDLEKIGTSFVRFEKSDKQVRDNDTIMVTHLLPDGTKVLDLSRPVVFMKKNLGAVHLGLSLPFIDGEVQKGMSGSIRAVILLGLILLGILLCSAIALFSWLQRTTYGPAALLEQRTEREEWYKGGEAVTIPACGTGEGANGYSANPRDSEMKQNQVTVLYAGIKDFMAYTEINDHQKLMEDLNGYLSLATDYIRKFGGYIDKFVGDAVIAVFGNSPHQADHAERALNAAVAMQKALQNSGQDGNQLLLKVGIGISSGVVLSGCVGSPAEKELTFIGESFKVAYSLNLMAGPGEIVMSRDAYRMIQPHVTVEPLPPREMMQRTNSWESFRLLKIIDSKDNPRHLDHDNNTSSIT